MVNIIQVLIQRKTFFWMILGVVEFRKLFNLPQSNFYFTLSDFDRLDCHLQRAYVISLC